ncbi:hypothetical protein J6590_002509 [Homalodisca vitripennis]|nr:hypothetical protein J6590_002509 [Homalodisca vitripennis]
MANDVSPKVETPPCLPTPTWYPETCATFDTTRLCVSQANRAVNTIWHHFPHENVTISNLPTILLVTVRHQYRKYRQSRSDGDHRVNLHGRISMLRAGRQSFPTSCLRLFNERSPAAWRDLHQHLGLTANAGAKKGNFQQPELINTFGW